MKLIVVAVGQRMPGWVDAAFDEYARRMPRETAVRLVEVKAEPRTESGDDEQSIRRLTEAEGRRIRSALPRDCYSVALDERGASMTTIELAKRIARWQMEGRDVAFVIGGADGLPQAFKREADLLWSLSPLTFAHGLVRVVVAEQLYRAVSILKGHPYHRE